MKTATVIFVGVATALNVSLWFLSRPRGTSHPEGIAIPTGQRDRQGACPTPARAADLGDRLTRPAPDVPRQAGDRVAQNPDQPWLSTVRDSVLQVSQSPTFIDKLAITGINCHGSHCSINGSTHASPDGEWHGSPDVAALMKAMNDGQIAGGDTGRSTFDAWKATHPEDFIADPDFPTIRNYNPQPVVH